MWHEVSLSNSGLTLTMTVAVTVAMDISSAPITRCGGSFYAVPAAKAVIIQTTETKYNHIHKYR